MITRLITSFQRNKQFLAAIAILVGTMVGVGVFAIPFAFAKAGFWVGFLFLLLAAGLTLVVDLMFGEIVLRTNQRHQLVGYVSLYLGPWFKRVELFANMLTMYGALLAYMIVSGIFLNNIFSHFWYAPIEVYSAVFFGIIAILIAWGIRTVASIELILTVFFGLVIVVIAALGIPHISLANFSGWQPTFWFLPYGILLFAFGGLSAVPLQRDILGSNPRALRRAIFWAVGLVGILYLVFAGTVVGVSGDITTPDALSGLFDTLGETIILLGSLFGIMTITTSSLSIGTALTKMFHTDYRIRMRTAWLMTVIPPVVLYFTGMRTFIDIIGLVGAVAAGIEGLMVVLVYRKAHTHHDRQPEYTIAVPPWLQLAIGIVFVSGIIYAIAAR